MKHWTIKQRILISFGIILLMVAIVAGTTYNKLATIDQDAQKIEKDTIHSMYLGSQIRAAWFESFSFTQQMVNIDNTEETRNNSRTKLANTSEKLDTLLQEYEKSVTDTTEKIVLDDFKMVRTDFNRGINDILKTHLEKGNQSARERLTEILTPHWQKGADIIARMTDVNKHLAEVSTQTISQSVRSTQNTLLLTLAATLITSILCGVWLLSAITRPMGALISNLEAMRSGDFSKRLNLRRRDEFGALESGFNRMTDELAALVGQAQKSALQVTTSVTQIAATAKQQQATATETAATTIEIGATSREISSTSRDLVRTMNEVSNGADQAATLAGNGQAGLTQMENTMHHVMDAAGSVNAKLSILNEKASNINQVVTTITRVAGQTNLLSLNAAIEAEKAGEYGRGFSVVAVEIRRLADQTAVATHDIEQMVKEIQSAVSAGVMGMDKFSEEVRRGMSDVQMVGHQLSQIIHQVQGLAPRFQHVNEGMQTQASGAEQINQALSQLSDAAQQTVESLNQSGQAIDELTLAANGLRNGVSRFKLKMN